MGSVVWHITVILLLILANGFFSLAEIAILSSRKALLREKADLGDPRAKATLHLLKHRDRFLATVQVGITAVGILAGAFGSATLAEPLGNLIASINWLAPYSTGLAVFIVVTVITCISIVWGELFPKRIALGRPEKFALLVTRPMLIIESMSLPFIRLLTRTTDLTLHLFRIDHPSELAVSEEEVKYLLKKGTQAGIFETEEHDMVEGVLELGDRMVSSLMTPSSEIDWLDMEQPINDIYETIIHSNRSRFPVAEGGLNKVIGIVRAKDLLRLKQLNSRDEILRVMQPTLFVPENMSALDVLKAFRESGTHLALVVDEYGEVIGVATVTDLLEAIVGEIPTRDDPQDDGRTVQREDGSYLVDGMLSIEELKDLLQVRALPDEDSGAYQTLGGLVMSLTSDIPSPGDKCQMGDWEFEVMDMDGMRVDKVLIKRQGPITG